MGWRFLLEKFIELLFSFDIDKFVWGPIARVWDDNPTYDAYDCVVETIVNFGHE